MTRVWMLARSNLRERWRSVVVLTLMVAFAGAVVLALLAGAHRTDTSLTRFEETSRSADLEVNVGVATPEQLRRFRESPGVVAVGELTQLTLFLSSGKFLPTAAQVDDGFGTVVDRPRVVEGRLARLGSVEELTIGESLADELGLEVGDRLGFTSFSPEDVARAEAVIDPSGPEVTFRIVGIVRRPLDLGGRGSAGGVVVPTPAFLERYGDEIGSFSGAVLRVRTERGAADARRVVRVARDLFGDSPNFSFTSLSIEGQAARDAIDVTTVGLTIAAVVALLTAVVGVSIAMSREISLQDGQQLTLSALGFRPRDRIAAAAAIGIPTSLIGAALASVGALLASPIFPIGIAARAEPDPGIRVDWAVIALGALGIVLVVMTIVALAAMRTARVTRADPGSATLGLAARVTAKTAAPVPLVVGVRFALDRGHQRHALPVRSSLFGAAFGTVIVVAVIVFSAGLHHLVVTPANFGWTWDFVAHDGETTVEGDGNDCNPIETTVDQVEGIADVASICNSSVEVAGRPVTAWGFRHLRGTIDPTIVSGRPPRDLREVVLGADTLAAVHRSVGDDVRIEGFEDAGTFRIVGQAAFPGLSDPQPLADGAAFTAESLGGLGANDGWNIVVRVAADADRDAIARRLAPRPGQGGEVSFAVPAEIDRVDQIRGLPVALAFFVSAVALSAVGLALVTSVRRRRRDLAVLKTLGFTRQQVRASVAWQATTVCAAGLLVGIPFGLVVGRFAWGAVAEELGVSTEPSWPALGVLLVVPVALLVVNLVAALPARRASRTRPAVVLRSE